MSSASFLLPSAASRCHFSAADLPRMSGIYNHRQMGPALGGRIPELLESLKSEYENLTQDVGLFNRQKDDVESKGIAIILIDFVFFILLI